MSKKHMPTKRVAYVLDKSGSMSCCRREAVEGTNRFLDSLREEDPHTRITITLFDTEVSVRTRNMPVAEVPDMPLRSYQPDGCTALYDAVAQTILTLDEAAGEDEVVLVAILTDGMENSSTRFTQQDVFRMIRQRQNTERWTFVFMGAEQDSWASAESMGIYAHNAVNFSVSEIDDSMGKLGKLSARYLSQQVACSAPPSQAFFGGKKDMKEVDIQDDDDAPANG